MGTSEGRRTPAVVFDTLTGARLRVTKHTCERAREHDGEADEAKIALLFVV
ncbi:MAG TPA: hypothetical protein VGX92_03715 [Pyrinomonadaceae bacterium]|jgi:hypothetical protein|nr:hypothetical protein [Pyrinomonadaceae bacterium]